MIIALLESLGRQARWVLAAGVLAALLFPGLAAPFKGTLPVMVVLVFALAVARLDIGLIVRRGLRPRRLLRLLAWVAALMIVTPCVIWAVASAAGLSSSLVASLVYATLAPPITSAAALCLIMGLDAALALELTVIASLLTPAIGPVLARLLLGADLPVEPIDLAARTAAMIVCGTGAGLLLRRALGPARIERSKSAFDGVVAISMVLFILPLFVGIGPMITANPAFTALVLTLSVAANIGLQFAAWAVLRHLGPVIGSPAETGALSMVWGNRAIALYLAALPGDPVFQLFVALYQIPMLLTPLVMQKTLSGPISTTRL